MLLEEKRRKDTEAKRKGMLGFFGKSKTQLGNASSTMRDGAQSPTSKIANSTERDKSLGSQLIDQQEIPSDKKD